MKAIGIYNASSSLLGEINYLYRKYMQGESCSMCDITHGLVRMKKDWHSLTAALPIDIVLKHTNEIDKVLLNLVAKDLPCVVLQSDASDTEKYQIILTRDELDACQGDIESFAKALAAKLEHVQV